MEKRNAIYSGKAKTVYATDHPDYRVLKFRDDTSAFNGEKKTQLPQKGAVNSQFNAFIMAELAKAGVPTHFERQLSHDETLVKALEMIPLEAVVRNRAAGSLCRRLGLEEGAPLLPPIYELFYKDDTLGDPMVNESYAISLGWATQAQLTQMQNLAFNVNRILSALFARADMILVDYKLEFGTHAGIIHLGDEFSPDGCRIWDTHTLEKMDKDRFRQDLGDVVARYLEVGRRLGIAFAVLEQ